MLVLETLFPAAAQAREARTMAELIVVARRGNPHAAPAERPRPPRQGPPAAVVRARANGEGLPKPRPLGERALHAARLPVDCISTLTDEDKGRPTDPATGAMVIPEDGAPLPRNWKGTQ